MLSPVIVSVNPLIFFGNNSNSLISVVFPVPISPKTKPENFVYLKFLFKLVYVSSRSVSFIYIFLFISSYSVWEYINL